MVKVMSRTGREYSFVCPKCDESLEVNDSMKDALIDSGCVICRAAVTSEAFTQIQSSDSS